VQSVYNVHSGSFLGLLYDSLIVSFSVASVVRWNAGRRNRKDLQGSCRA